MKSKIKGFLSRLPLSLYIIVFLGLLMPVHWFSDGRVIAGGDHFIYLNPSSVFFESLFTWLNRLNFGEPNFSIAFLFPFLSFFKFFNLLGVSPVIAQTIWATYLFLGSGLFMYLLVYHLAKKSDAFPAGAAFIAALFYMFNPYTMQDLLQISLRPVHVVLPLLLLIWIKGLSSKAGNLKFSVIFALATLLVSSSGTSPAYLAVIFIAIFLYTAYFLIFNKTRGLDVILYSLRTGCLSLLINLWWIIPAALAYFDSGSTLEQSIKAGDYTKATPIWEAFRLLGFWAFRINWKENIPHIPYAPNYYQPLFLLFSYLLIALAFTGLLIKKRLKKGLVFFSLLFLMGVFLSKGANLPLGGYYEFLFKNFSPFALFREPYTKFTTLSLFSLSVMLGLSWGMFLLKLSSLKRLVITTLFSLSILTYSFPILTGQSFQDPSWHGRTIESLHVQPPKAWLEIGRYFQRTDPDGRVMLFPRTSYGLCYRWEMGACTSQPVARLFLPNQTIRHTAVPSYHGDLLLNRLYDSFLDGRLINISSVLAPLGIRYALLQGDMNWRDTERETLTSGEMESLLDSQATGLKKIHQEGPLSVYESTADKTYPLIFATNQLSFISGNEQDVIAAASFKKPVFPESFYLIDRGGTNTPSFIKEDPGWGEEIMVYPTLSEKEDKNGSLFFPQDGQYTIYHRSNLLGSESSGLVLEFLVGDRKYALTLPNKSSGREVWSEIGTVTVKAGSYPLSLGSDSPVTVWQGSTYELSDLSFPAGNYRVFFNFLLAPGYRGIFTLSEQRCESSLTSLCSFVSIVNDELPSNPQPLKYAKNVELFLPAKSLQAKFGLSKFTGEDTPLKIGPLSLMKNPEHELFFRKLGGSQPVEKKESIPAVSFIQVNPTRYEVTVKGPPKPFLLTFLNTYNQSWKAGLSGKTLSEDRHILINGFANGWLVLPEDTANSKEYKITLEYTPQRLFYLGSVISLVSILASIFYLVKTFRKVSV